MDKRFRYIPGYNNRYACSRDGEILSFIGTEPHILKHQIHKKGYLQVALYDPEGIKYHNGGVFVSVASIILNVWGEPKPSDKHKASFKDGDRTNLSLDNLEWCTQQDLARKANKVKYGRKS